MQCKRCINDDSVRNISFDEEGVCNYCRRFNEIKEKILGYQKLEKMFQTRVDKVRGKHQYDVAVGISGGKDSIYVLDQLLKKYHLKVKAFTMNNGFLTEEAKKNIDRLVNEYGVEHEYIDYEQELLRRVYHYSMKHFLVPCVACSYVGYASMIGYAAKIDAGMCVHGRSPEQMLRYYDSDMFSTLLKLGLKDTDDFDLDKEYIKLFRELEQKADKGLFEEVRKAALGDLEKGNFREFVPYYLYHEYDEEKIVEYLKANTGWRPPKKYDHYDCEIQEAAKYIYQCAEGRPHILPEISVLIRMGKITREEGLKRLESAWIDKKPKEKLAKLCNTANVSQAAVLTKAKIYNRIIKK